jgi:hypothetical protein
MGWMTVGDAAVVLGSDAADIHLLLAGHGLVGCSGAEGQWLVDPDSVRDQLRRQLSVATTVSTVPTAERLDAGPVGVVPMPATRWMAGPTPRSATVPAAGERGHEAGATPSSSVGGTRGTDARAVVAERAGPGAAAADADLNGRSGVRGVVEGDAPPGPGAAEPADRPGTLAPVEDNGPVDVVEQGRFAAQVILALEDQIDALTVQVQEAVVALDAQGCPPTEIAATLAVAQTAVERLLRDAQVGGADGPAVGEEGHGTSSGPADPSSDAHTPAETAPAGRATTTTTTAASSADDAVVARERAAPGGADGSTGGELPSLDRDRAAENGSAAGGRAGGSIGSEVTPLRPSPGSCDAGPHTPDTPQVVRAVAARVVPLHQGRLAEVVTLRAELARDAVVSHGEPAAPTSSAPSGPVPVAQPDITAEALAAAPGCLAVAVPRRAGLRGLVRALFRR